jgi:hypothetical protein
VRIKIKALIDLYRKPNLEIFRRKKNYYYIFLDKLVMKGDAKYIIENSNRFIVLPGKDFFFMHD